MGGQTSVVLGILHKSSSPFTVPVPVRLWRCLVGQLTGTQALCRSRPEQGTARLKPRPEAGVAFGRLPLLPPVVTAQ